MLPVKDPCQEGGVGSEGGEEAHLTRRGRGHALQYIAGTVQHPLFSVPSIQLYTRIINL